LILIFQKQKAAEMEVGSRMECPACSLHWQMASSLAFTPQAMFRS
jgi:hypothetical protein